MSVTHITIPPNVLLVRVSVTHSSDDNANVKSFYLSALFHFHSIDRNEHVV